MSRTKRIVGIVAFFGVVALIATFIIIPMFNVDDQNVARFPDFYTKTKDYFITRIEGVPHLTEDNYKLKISGQIDNPTEYSLSELRALPLIEFPLTIECIGNPTNGALVSTANWSGFNVYDLISPLGLKSNATGVKYYAADGYYATHTLDQLQNNSIIGAIYMNNLTLPPIQGFPLRVINPGYYGAKQPAWVTEIEVIDMPLSDYWDDRGWDTSPRMPIDSKFFFPSVSQIFSVGTDIIMGGAAYGGTRVTKVEYTINGGLNWDQAEIVKSIDKDHVWVFWSFNLTFADPGLKTIYIRATDIFNHTQPQIDHIIKDGSNSWASLIITVR